MAKITKEVVTNGMIVANFTYDFKKCYWKHHHTSHKYITSNVLLPLPTPLAQQTWPGTEEQQKHGIAVTVISEQPTFANLTLTATSTSQ